MSIPLLSTHATCHMPGEVYLVVLRRDIGIDAAALASWKRFESCYRFKAPAPGFVRAELLGGRIAATIKPILVGLERS